MKKLIASVSLIALLLSACGSTVKIHQLNAGDFSKKIQESGVTTLDVRTAGEFAAGHIAGAINIDVEGGAFKEGISALDKNGSYAIYCHSGRRSMIAANEMAKSGFKNLFNLTNGVNEWSAAGGELVQ